MAAEILSLLGAQPDRTGFGHAIRTGDNPCCQFEKVHAGNRLSAQKLVVDAVVGSSLRSR